MYWWQFALLGASGGALTEFLAVFKGFADWQTARRTPTGKVRRHPPVLRSFIDLPAHACMTVFRTALGAGAATLCGIGGDIRGAYVAVAVGVAAPAVLAQLGAIPQVAGAVRGGSKSEPPEGDIASRTYPIARGPRGRQPDSGASTEVRKEVADE